MSALARRTWAGARGPAWPLGIGGALLVGVVVATWPTETGVALAVGTGVVAAVAIAHHLAYRKDPLDPLVGFGLPYLLYYGIGLIPIPGYQESFGVKVPAELYAFIGLGLVAFLVGRRLAGSPETIGTGSEPTPSLWSPQRAQVVMLVLAALGLAALALMAIAAGGVPALATDPEVARFAFRPLAGVSSLLMALVAAALVAVVLASRGGSFRPLAMIVLGIAITGLFALQIRTLLFQLLVGALVLVHYRYRRISVAVLGTSVVVTLVGLLVFAEFRSVYQAGGDLHGAVVRLATRTGLPLDDSPGGLVGWMATLVYVQSRHTVDTFAVWFETLNRSRYFWGQLTLSDWLTVLPGRRSDSGAVTETILSDYGQPVFTPQPPGMVGAYFGEAGLLGVVLGMGIFGYVLQTAYRRMRQLPTEGRTLAYGLVLAFGLIGLYGMGLIAPSTVLPMAFVLIASTFARATRQRSDYLVWAFSLLGLLALMLKIAGGNTPIQT